MPLMTADEIINAAKIPVDNKPAEKLLSADEILQAYGLNEHVASTWSDVPGKALSNIPKDLASVGQSYIDMASNPVETAKGLGKVLGGGIEHAVRKPIVDYAVEHGLPDYRPNASAAVAPLLHDLSNPKEALSERPVQSFLNLAGLLSGGKSLLKAANGKELASALSESELNAARTNALNAPKASALQAGQEAGYVVPPSEVNPSWMNKRLEGMAGKAAIGQQAAAENQPVTTALARQALGMQVDEPISISALNGIRKEAGKPYQEIAQLPTPPSIANGYSQTRTITSPKVDLESLKQARNDSQGWYDAAKVSKSPDDLAKAKKFEAIANTLEDKIAQSAQSAGRGDLSQSLKDSRKKIAQTYNVQKALNKVTGEVNANDIGKLIDEGRPVTGELKTIGDFQQAFPKFLREGEKIPSAGVSKSEALAMLLMGGGGAAAAGPMGAMFGALPLLSTPVRNMLLSKLYQKNFAKIPVAKTSSILRRTESLANTPIDKALMAGLLSNRNNYVEK